MPSQYAATDELRVGNDKYQIHTFDAIQDQSAIAQLPFSLRILLENLLRHSDSEFVQDEHIEAIIQWSAKAPPSQAIDFVPARVLLQDFTGVPAIVDLAAMRNAMASMGGDPKKINPLSPVELVIDHSVMVDYFASPDALAKNTEIEIKRNRERYQFLKWGQQSFNNFKVVPPGTGIVHQVNLEYLARGVFVDESDGQKRAYPDTLVGTDSHTTMINGLGVLGWGVGGIEAEAAMLGQPISMMLPEVVGFKLTGKLPALVTATDLVLTVTQMLRSHGVVGKFVEFYGPGLSQLTLADRATISNMAPEYGATCGLFPIDAETLRYLALTGRDAHHVALVEAYTRRMGLWHDANSPDANYSSQLTLDLSDVEACIAGPKRPQDRINLSAAKKAFRAHLQSLDIHVEATKNSVALAEDEFVAEGGDASLNSDRVGNEGGASVNLNSQPHRIHHGSVVIAAITSCTNTSNPAVMIAAGLLARNAVARGLKSAPWVKTSLAPGSQVVPEYLRKANLLSELEALGFYVVGFGCTTCIGNSGPLSESISRTIRDEKLVVASVLSGNRNFEGRIHQDVRANYLASPPLVVAYALAGTMDIDFNQDPLGYDKDQKAVFLKDIWPSNDEINNTIERCIDAALFATKYADVYAGNSAWNDIEISSASIYDWPDSTYIKHPPFFVDIQEQSSQTDAITDARVLVKVGDSITTDHISPAGAIKSDSPAGEYLQAQGVEPRDFNSYGSRRGNHEVMMRGTFANGRLKNAIAPGTEGGWTTYMPSNERVSIFAASEKYRQVQTPVIVLAGKEYGTGSSRDWAAKGPKLLGVKAVIAESFERIHRSNLVGMGILPLQFKDGDSCDKLNLSGLETYSIPPIKPGVKAVEIVAMSDKGDATRFVVSVRIDTENEYAYYKSGGILNYVLHKLED